MKAAVIVFPGSNCDRDIAVALQAATGRAPQMVWHQQDGLPTSVDLIALPGGFSFGDYLRCGAIAARSPVMGAVVRHARAGGAVIGVCNGWQLLTEAGLLPGALLRNKTGRFIRRDAHLRVAAASIFTEAYLQAHPADRPVIRLPVAHHDGAFFADDATLDALEAEDRVAFRYVDAAGRDAAEANFNGSSRAIAGVLSENRRVLGMMPHPERAVSETIGGVDGAALFRGLAEALGAETAAPALTAVR